MCFFIIVNKGTGLSESMVLRDNGLLSELLCGWFKSYVAKLKIKRKDSWDL